MHLLRRKQFKSEGTYFQYRKIFLVVPPTILWAPKSLPLILIRGDTVWNWNACVFHYSFYKCMSVYDLHRPEVSFYSFAVNYLLIQCAKNLTNSNHFITYYYKNNSTNKNTNPMYPSHLLQSLLCYAYIS